MAPIVPDHGPTAPTRAARIAPSTASTRLRSRSKRAMEATDTTPTGTVHRTDSRVRFRKMAVPSNTAVRYKHLEDHVARFRSEIRVGAPQHHRLPACLPLLVPNKRRERAGSNDDSARKSRILTLLGIEDESDGLAYERTNLTRTWNTTLHLSWLLGSRSRDSRRFCLALGVL